MTIDPRFGFWLSVGLAVLGYLATTAAILGDLGVGAAGVKAIMAGISLLLGIGSTINAVLHAIPSSTTPAAQAAFYLGPKPPAAP